MCASYWLPSLRGPPRRRGGAAASPGNGAGGARAAAGHEPAVRSIDDRAHIFAVSVEPAHEGTFEGPGRHDWGRVPILG